MSSDEPVSRWISELKAGHDGEAQQKLWDYFYERLVLVARKQLKGSPQRMEDEEDAVGCAMKSFYMRVQCGQYPEVRDRKSLWHLLLKITNSKAVNQQRRAFTKKRGAGKGRGESIFRTAAEEQTGLDKIAGQEPTPEREVETIENAKRLMEKLDDEKLSEVAFRKLAGFTNKEIAVELGVIVRTIERRLERIREIWSEERGE